MLAPVVLAAGASTRMGSPKAVLVDRDGLPFVARVAALRGTLLLKLRGGHLLVPLELDVGEDRLALHDVAQLHAAVGGVLGELAQQALDNVNASLDEIRDEVAQMEAAGQVQPDVRAIRAAEAVDPDELDEDGVSTAPEESDVTQPVEGVQPPAMTAEEAIAELREKIDRMGPVNMMAIEQSKELEERHSFLSTQRQDLVDSIAQTNEAISKIDETTHARFKEAFAAINENFQQMFSTLFGVMGLALADPQAQLTDEIIKDVAKEAELENVAIDIQGKLKAGRIWDKDWNKLADNVYVYSSVGGDVRESYEWLARQPFTHFKRG